VEPCSWFPTHPTQLVHLQKSPAQLVTQSDTSASAFHRLRGFKAIYKAITICDKSVNNNKIIILPLGKNTVKKNINTLKFIFQ
jgi:hypothetical protein